MQWDVGLLGLTLLGALSVGYGVLAGLLVSRGVAHRTVAAAVTTVACFGVGLLTSEVLFGWATEEDLQPNVDGLSRDEVLLSSAITTAVVVLVMRYLVHHEGAHHKEDGDPARHRRVIGRHAPPTGRA